MTDQTVLTDKERELVAIGAAIGAGCQPCTHYHVTAALKSGLSGEEIGRAVDAAEDLRQEGGLAVTNLGRRLLGIEQPPPRWNGSPSDRAQALTYIGAAAGCNAGGLLTPSLDAARELGLSPDELRSALEMAEVVKQHAAEFLRREVERALPEAASTAAAPNGSLQSCAGAECSSEPALSTDEVGTSTGGVSCC